MEGEWENHPWSKPFWHQPFQDTLNNDDINLTLLLSYFINAIDHINRTMTQFLRGRKRDRGWLCNSDQFRAMLKGLSHEIDFKNFDKNLQNLA